MDDSPPGMTDERHLHQLFQQRSPLGRKIREDVRVARLVCLWDRNIPTGGKFNQVIRQELGTAKVCDCRVV